MGKYKDFIYFLVINIKVHYYKYLLLFPIKSCSQLPLCLTMLYQQQCNYGIKCFGSLILGTGSNYRGQFYSLEVSLLTGVS